MSEIYAKKSGIFVLKPQLNHLYLIEEPINYNKFPESLALATPKFAIYKGIDFSKKTHTFFTLDNESIDSYECSLDNCELDTRDILNINQGLPKIIVQSSIIKKKGLNDSNRLNRLEYDYLYPNLKQILDQYGNLELHLKTEFSDLIKLVISEKPVRYAEVTEQK